MWKKYFSKYKWTDLFWILFVNEYKKFEVTAKKNLRLKGSTTNLLSVL